MEDPSVRVTVRDIYDRLLQTEQKLDDFISEWRGTQIPARLQDHEARIRRTEAWLYAIPAALLMAVINAVTIWVLKP